MNLFPLAEKAKLIGVPKSLSSSSLETRCPGIDSLDSLAASSDFGPFSSQVSQDSEDSWGSDWRSSACLNPGFHLDRDGSDADDDEFAERAIFFLDEELELHAEEEPHQGTRGKPEHWEVVLPEGLELRDLFMST
mmetsp:Transcript_25722/g.56726  ORF Transcript_25722/g.56726 Transcript_25722/m.56726 type:complete len:135 (+) Transcript_25722:47-451(+)